MADQQYILNFSFGYSSLKQKGKRNVPLQKTGGSFYAGTLNLSKFSAYGNLSCQEKTR